MAGSRLQASYRKILLDMLPSGRAWVKQNSTLADLVDALVTEYCRIQERADTLLNVESDPRSTSELLTDWETMLGIPDECTDLAATQGDRQNQVVQKLTLVGATNAQFYIDLAATLGFVITIDEISRFLVGFSRVGDRLTNAAWDYYWIVNADEFLVTPFRVGQGVAGDPLVKFGNDTLECTIKKYAPAHTSPIFAFGGGF